MVDTNKEELVCGPEMTATEVQERIKEYHSRKLHPAQHWVLGEDASNVKQENKDD